MNFVAKCKNCQQVKYEHQRPIVLHQSIPMLVWKWERIDNFMVGLSKTSRKFDAIWVVVDRLTKSNHFILIRVDFNADVKEMRLHGVPLSIISNHGTQFTSKF